MGGSILFSGPKVMRLGDLLLAIAKQEVRIPRFQRPFVWEDAQRLELLESIYRGMPIGSFMLWSTEQQLECYDRLGRFEFTDPPPSGRVEYVLDGHQRLTTLFGALVPGVLEGYRDAPQGGYAPYDEEDGARWPIYFNLATERFTFGDGVEGEQARRLLLRMDEALDSFKMFDVQRALMMSDEATKSPEDYKRYANLVQHVARIFTDYQTLLAPLLTDDLDAAAEAFRRVNASGTKMSEAHMIHALTFKKDIRLVERLDEMRQALAPAGWHDVSDDVLIKLIKLRLGMDPGRANPEGIVERLSGADSGVVDEAVSGLVRAVAFLRESADIYGPKLLPYEMQLVFLADVLCKVPMPSDLGAVALTRWLWRTTAQGGEFLSYKAQRDELRQLVRSSGGVIAGGGGKRLSLSPQFNAPHAASKVWMMLLAKEAGKHVMEGEEEPLRVAGREGVAAFWRMPSAEADEVAGRFYVPLGDQGGFAARLAGEQASKEFLARHLLPEVPYRGPSREKGGDAKTRSGRLMALWRDFWREQGFEMR
jgi:hypothetical protein